MNENEIDIRIHGRYEDDISGPLHKSIDKQQKSIERQERSFSNVAKAAEKSASHQKQSSSSVATAAEKAAGRQAHAAEKVARSTEHSAARQRKAWRSIGKVALAVTAIILGVGAASIKASIDFNKGMANVATLIPGNIERVNELKQSVQSLSIETGKSTEDLSEGLYQVISAFGDSAEAAIVLKIAAKAAVAGVAETADAINLLSAVTKGYGDISAEAAKKTSDLAFMTVKLGQTTFPELAAVIGRVVPLAKALGVEQEILFAQFATLTGVTGNAAEVSTQLRATYQAFIKPTEDMANAIGRVSRELDAQGKLVQGPLVQAWKAAEKELDAAIGKMQEMEKKGGGKGLTQQKKLVKELEKVYKDASAALGPAIVESLGGFDAALVKVAATAEGNTNVLGKMFGSVESINAVLALTGAQADAFREKLAAMQEAAGTTDEAYKEQTEGINAFGHAINQIKSGMTVVMQIIGDALAPALSKLGVEMAAWLEKTENLDKIRQMGELLALVASWAGTLLKIIGKFAIVWAQVVSAIVGKIKEMWDTGIANFKAGCEMIKNIWNATGGAIIEKAREVLSWLNPVASHSPSMVDNWRAGMSAMRSEYSAFASFVASQRLQPALAGGFGGGYAPAQGYAAPRQAGGSSTTHNTYNINVNGPGKYTRADGYRYGRDIRSALQYEATSGIRR